MSAPRFDVSFRTDITVEQLSALWTEIEESARPSLFLSWRWVGCWLRQTALTPNILLAHQGGGLAGLALLQPGRGAVFPHLQGRYLTASGIPDFDSVFIEYNGFLARPEDEACIGHAFQDFLSRSKPGTDALGGWSRLYFPGTRDGMRDLWTKDRFVVRRDASRSAPFIELGKLRENGGTYLDSRSSNCRQQIRRSMRLFETRGPLELDVASSLDEARDILDELKRLHQRSWRTRGKPGAFASPFFERFHRAFLEEAWPAGQIDLLRLRAGPHTIGCLYNFVHHGDAYAYQSGFAYEDDSRLKPGLAAHAMAAERYLAMGMNRYLLLAGDARYKTSLANGADTLHWLVVRRKGFQAAAEEWAERAGRKFSGLALS
jgi:CelD/BcsL family acetyltransferase involved in cellulose biosynthesis